MKISTSRVAGLSMSAQVRTLAFMMRASGVTYYPGLFLLLYHRLVSDERADRERLGEPKLRFDRRSAVL